MKHIRRKSIVLFSLILLITISCNKKSDDKPLDKLVQALEKELEPLSENPLLWSNNDLKFLDPIAHNSIIGLGEATHGTAQFSKAKHRIFKYLAENHDYKIFAFETDFGESLIINDAVQRSDSGAIEDLMKTKMHFWTWRTEEVKDLLVWMCTYNLDKSVEEKVQYMGIDCQFNTFNPDMVKAYLTKTVAPFYSIAEGILNEAKIATQEGFKSYSEETFNNYLDRIDALQDTFAANKIKLIETSSEKQYQLHARILKIVREVSVVTYNSQKGYNSINYRDQYMAENASWLLDYFNGGKVIVWAHNGHIANDPEFASMGYNLNRMIANNYAIIGFLFSKGTFTARGMEGDQITDPKEQVIEKDPNENSINFVMSQCQEPAFAIKDGYLQNYREWNEAFAEGIRYFQIGSVFNNIPASYYDVYNPAFFDYIIYFDKSTASVILK